jgi:transcriptional regulator with XRE-family HTH domain
MRSTRHAIAIHFGRNLIDARERANLSQEVVAVRASLHRTEIGMLERGERLPGIDTAIKLAAALGVEVGSLLSGLDWTPGSTSAGSFKVEGKSEGGGV